MNNKLMNENNNFLFECFLKLKTVEECYAFFEDICTASEIQEMGKRMRAAKMLYDGKLYIDITNETGLSTATVSRVNRCLKFGADGYNLVLERMSKSK